MTSNSNARVIAGGLLAALLMACGCGGSATPGSATVTISPAAAVTLDAGQSLSFTASVMGDSSNGGVHWQLQGVGALSNETAASVLYTAPGSLNSATTSAVEAIPVANNTASATTLLNLFPALSITTASAPAATINTNYSLQLASTGGSGTVSWALASGSLPTGLTISSKGLISGSPSQYGSYSFIVSATDAATTPMVVTKALTIIVNATTLTISTTSLPNVVLGSSYSATAVATGGITPYTWSVASGVLPTGMSFSAAGTLSGTPTAAGSYTFSLQVTDTEAAPQIATKSFTVIVYSKLSISTTSLPNGAQNTAYSQILQSTGGSNPLTWSISSGTLPAGLSLSTAGVLSGTATVSGTFSFTAQVADASVPQQVATQAYTLVIVAPLTITTSTLPDATINNTYTFTLMSTGGNAPVTWSLLSGSLPHGLTLSAAGVIQGTPTQAETQSFTVQASDATPSSVTKTFSLSVDPLSALVVTTSSIPNGNVGVAYSTAFAASGGAIPYTWSLVSGTLPAGLTLSTSGVLAGTPTTLGSYTFTVQVKDNQTTPAIAMQSFTVMIRNAGATAALKGSYAFLLSGFRSGNAPSTVYGFAEIGSLALDGAGAVTGIADVNAPNGAQQSVAVTGSYSLGVDGRGLLSLTVGTTTSSYAIAASQAVSGVVQSFQLIEFDNVDGSGSQASGFARMQATPSFLPSTLTGTFAFGLSGESCNACANTGFGPVAAAGIVKGDGISALSSGAEDTSTYGHNFAGITLAGAFAAPSTTTGRGTLTMLPVGTTMAAQPVDFTYVVVNTNELLLMSNDSHATNALLYGDAQLQRQTSYSSATEFAGTSIGYESQASGGDGASVYPVASNVMLYQLANTGSGTATLFEDSNKAGTFASSSSASAVTYATNASGRVAIVTGQGTSHIVYLYNTGAGFGIDSAASNGYPGVLRYELYVAQSASLPPLLTGMYGVGTLSTPVRSSVVSGTSVYSPVTGGADTMVINGTVAKGLDSSSTSGAITVDQTATLDTAESYKGRQVETTTPAGTIPSTVTYVITGSHAVSIPASGSTPIVMTLQQ